MEEQQKSNYSESAISCGEHISKKLYKSIRTCLVFPEKVIGIVPLGDTDEVSDYVLEDKLIFKEKLVRVESVGNSVFLENLTTSNSNGVLLKFYVVLESCTFPVSALNNGSYSSSKHQIYKFTYK